MKFWITTLGLWSVIDKSTSSFSSMTTTTPEKDYLCKGRILSALSDSLYDIYTLESEYGLNDAGVERFNTASFLRFNMVDDTPINDQIHKFQ